MENKKLIDTRLSLNLNSVKIARGETLEHALAKFLLSYEAIQNGHKIITECKFNNGKQADIFIMSIPGGIAWEIMASETNKMLETKEYPCPIISFKAKEVIRMNLKVFK